MYIPEDIILFSKSKEDHMDHLRCGRRSWRSSGLRCVGATNEADPKERTPIFAQWLMADTVSRAGHPPPGRAALMPPPPARER